MRKYLIVVLVFLATIFQAMPVFSSGEYKNFYYQTSEGIKKESRYVVDNDYARKIDQKRLVSSCTSGMWKEICASRRDFIRIYTDDTEKLLDEGEIDKAFGPLEMYLEVFVNYPHVIDEELTKIDKYWLHLYSILRILYLGNKANEVEIKYLQILTEELDGKLFSSPYYFNPPHGDPNEKMPFLKLPPEEKRGHDFYKFLNRFFSSTNEETGIDPELSWTYVYYIKADSLNKLKPCIEKVLTGENCRIE